MDLKLDHQARSDLLIKAHAIVGKCPGDGTDNGVSPANLAERVPPEFAELKALLATTQLTELKNEFKLQDEAADRWQGRYRFAERLRILLFFIALCLGAYALSPWATNDGPAVERLISLAQGSAIAIAFAAIALSIGVNFYGKWRKARARAEFAKGSYFHLLVHETIEPENPGHIPSILQKLEFMRRYRLEHQHAYMATKVADHEKGEGRRRLLLYVAASLALLVALPVLAKFLSELGYSQTADALSAIASTLFGPDIALAQYFLALGVIAAGLEATIENYFRIEQDLRFAAHFRNTGRELEALGAELATVRRKMADGDDQAATNWLIKLENVLFKEHERWLDAHGGAGDPLRQTTDIAPPIE